VREGVARLSGGGSIAGSTATAASVFRRAVRESGIALPDAVRLSATNPAMLLGLTDRGSVSPGLRADLLVLDEDLAVRKVLTG
jgi:N-acetylglucosamine-6-phosphate deacetylase